MVTTGSPLETVLKVDLPESAKGTDSLANLKPGDILNGKVVKSVTSGGAAMVRFGGQKVSLPNNSNLVSGQKVTAEVLKVSLEILLKVVSPKNQSNAYREVAPNASQLPKTGSGNVVTLVINTPESLKNSNVLSLARPGDIITGTVVKPLGHNQAIIRIGGVEILSASSQPLSMGETITARVERILPQVTLKVLQENFPAPVQEKLSETLTQQLKPTAFQEVTLKFQPNQLKGGLTLKEGQLTDVKVLRQLSANKAVFDIAGRQVEAAARGMEAGKTMSMMVDSLSPELVLKSVNPNQGFNLAKATDFIREFLPGREPMGKIVEHLGLLVTDEKLPEALKSHRSLLEGLRQALNESVITRPDKHSTPLLQKAVNNSGLNYEANIKTAMEVGVAPEEISNTLVRGDLKGELLKLEILVNERLAMLKGGSQETQAQIQELRTFGNSIRSAINQIELNQVMNAVNHREGSSVFFQVPFVSANGEMKTMEVFVKNRKKKGGKKGEEAEDCNVTLLLDMTSLGPLRADVHIQQNSLHGKIITQDKEVAEFINSQLPLLDLSLNELGYTSKLECSVTQEEKVVASAISEKIPIEKLGILDVKV